MVLKQPFLTCTPPQPQKKDIKEKTIMFTLLVSNESIVLKPGTTNFLFFNSKAAHRSFLAN
uniref:Uncharacterized protein n=1 Tax=Rhizophora mucronata TaxID=61149 RepID=A0A2P2PLI8_RHIMU